MCFRIENVLLKWDSGDSLSVGAEDEEKKEHTFTFRLHAQKYEQLVNETRPK